MLLSLFLFSLFLSTIHACVYKQYRTADSASAHTCAAKPAHSSSKPPVSCLEAAALTDVNVLDVTIPPVLFDWFDGNIDLELSHLIDSDTPVFMPPPTPMKFRPSLLSFWPVSNESLWHNATQQRQIYDSVRRTGLPNFLEAKIPVPLTLHIPTGHVLLADFPDTSLVDLLEFGFFGDHLSHLPLRHGAKLAP